MSVCAILVSMTFYFSSSDGAGNFTFDPLGDHQQQVTGLWVDLDGTTTPITGTFWNNDATAEFKFRIFIGSAESEDFQLILTDGWVGWEVEKGDTIGMIASTEGWVEELVYEDVQ